MLLALPYKCGLALEPRQALNSRRGQKHASRGRRRKTGGAQFRNSDRFRLPPSPPPFPCSLARIIAEKSCSPNPPATAALNSWSAAAPQGIATCSNAPSATIYAKSFVISRSWKFAVRSPDVCRAISVLIIGEPTTPSLSVANPFSLSTPSRSNITNASLNAAACTPHRKLLISLNAAPVPTGPKCTTFLPITPSTGRTAANVPTSPPTRKLSSPFAACGFVPLTGASRNRTPFFPQSAANSFTHGTVSVLHSIATAPPAIPPTPASAPRSPSHTSREATSSASIAINTPAPFAASRGQGATRAPISASATVLSRLRLYTATSYPAPNSRRTIPPPIVPKPKNARRGFSTAVFMLHPTKQTLHPQG